MLTAIFLLISVLFLGRRLALAVHLGTGILFAVMGLLGMGNGAVFQLVPQRFPREIGVITGVVGAAGGIGGFFLPTSSED